MLYKHWRQTIWATIRQGSHTTAPYNMTPSQSHLQNESNPKLLYSDSDQAEPKSVERYRLHVSFTFILRRFLYMHWTAYTRIFLSLYHLLSSPYNWFRVYVAGRMSNPGDRYFDLKIAKINDQFSILSKISLIIDPKGRNFWIRGCYLRVEVPNYSNLLKK